MYCWNNLYKEKATWIEQKIPSTHILDTVGDRERNISPMKTAVSVKVASNGQWNKRTTGKLEINKISHLQIRDFN